MLLVDLVELYIAARPDLSVSRRSKFRTFPGQWHACGLPADVRLIGTDHCAEFRRAMLKTHKPVSIETSISMLRALLRFAGPRSSDNPEGRGLIAEIPYFGRRLKVVIPVRPPASLADLGMLYRGAAQWRYRPRLWDAGDSARLLRTWLVTGYNTGLRMGDLHRIDWSMIDRQARIIAIPNNKTGKTLLLPINATLDAHLAQAPQRSGLLLPIPDGSQHHFRRSIRALCDELAISHISNKPIRRLAATEFERAHPGAGPLLLGHTQQRNGAEVSWAHYMQAIETVLRPASEKIPQPWGAVASMKGVEHDARHDDQEPNHDAADSACTQG